jgi:hypothetical protein
VDTVKIALIFSKLSIQQIKLDEISELYIESDAMTWKISGEKDYRQLIRNGVIEPNKPTQTDIDLFNSQMDTKIDTLNSGRTLQYNRIFNNSDVNDLNNSYRGQIKYLQDIKDTYDAYPSYAGGCPQYVIDYLDQFNGFYNDINNIVWLNGLEKQLYSSFDSEIDAQIDAINKDKY